MNNKEKIEKYLKVMGQKRLDEIQKDWVKRKFDYNLTVCIESGESKFSIDPRHPSEKRKTYELVKELIEEEDLTKHLTVNCLNFETSPITVFFKAFLPREPEWLHKNNDHIKALYNQLNP